ncbi:hypothetical protein MTBLM1_80239 [Rhodospirillaceae bacterium LM-1]|nr:hypothetical protein MTBLM1_80239 [Rhodospirillaceae bacterium LM-1]
MLILPRAILVEEALAAPELIPESLEVGGTSFTAAAPADLTFVAPAPPPLRWPSLSTASGVLMHYPQSIGRL